MERKKAKVLAACPLNVQTPLIVHLILTLNPEQLTTLTPKPQI